MPVLLLIVLLIAATQELASEPPLLPAAPVPALAASPSIPDADYELLESKHDLVWQVFTPEVFRQYWIERFDDLKEATQTNRIVEISDTDGIQLRKDGKWPIAEMEKIPGHLQYYYGLEKSAAGLLYKIRDYMKDTEGQNFKPLVLTSLVRSWQYQKLLMKVNPNARTVDQDVPPTHVFGLAFDITRVGMSKAQEICLENYLDLLSLQRELIYFKEGKAQATFHVIARPDAKPQLEAYYEQSTTNLMAYSGQ